MGFLVTQERRRVGRFSAGQVRTPLDKCVGSYTNTLNSAVGKSSLLGCMPTPMFSIVFMATG